MIALHPCINSGVDKCGILTEMRQIQDIKDALQMKKKQYKKL